jgi:hypothetical protein
MVPEAPLEETDAARYLPLRSMSSIR